jgi:CDP-glycerol glycerophosphotransferase (TagB/SpsB family)
MYRPFDVSGRRLLTVEQIRERSFDLLFAANTKMIMPREASARVQIFHGISFRNKAVRAENAGADHFFMVGPYMRRAFMDAGLLPEGDRRAIPIGFPKTDQLLDGSLDRTALLRIHGFDGRRPVLLYAPTGERHNSLETMGEEVLRRLAATGRYDLLVKLHDHPKDTEIDWTARLAAMEDDHTRLARGPDVIPLLFIADLLITDASSVSSEYALLDRPMVFLDVPKLLAKAAAAQGSMLDLNTWGRRAGAIIARAEDAERTIAASLADPSPWGEVRRAMARSLFYNPGRATEAAAAWFTQVLAAVPVRSTP